MSSHLIVNSSHELPKIYFYQVLIDEIFIGWDNSVYQKVSETECHRIQNENGLLSASSNIHYGGQREVLKIATEAFRLTII